MILLIVRARHRYKAILVVSHCLHFLTLLRLALSAVPVLTVTITSALWPHVSCCSHHRVSNSMPRLKVSLLIAHLCASHGIPVKAASLRPRLRSAISVTPPQPPVCTIHVGTHPVRSATAGKRRASTALAGTHNLIDTDPRAGTRPSPKPQPSFFLWSSLVNLNLMGTVVLIQPTVITCIINFACPSFSGIQARRAEIPLTLSPLSVAS